jgi:hypothetical protein
VAASRTWGLLFDEFYHCCKRNGLSLYPVLVGVFDTVSKETISSPIDATVDFQLDVTEHLLSSNLTSEEFTLCLHHLLPLFARRVEEFGLSQRSRQFAASLFSQKF